MAGDNRFMILYAWDLGSHWLEFKCRLSESIDTIGIKLRCIKVMHISNAQRRFFVLTRSGGLQGWTGHQEGSQRRILKTGPCRDEHEAASSGNGKSEMTQSSMPSYLTACQMRIEMRRQSTSEDNCMASRAHEHIQAHLRRGAFHLTGSPEAKIAMQLAVHLHHRLVTCIHCS